MWPKLQITPVKTFQSNWDVEPLYAPNPHVYFLLNTKRRIVGEVCDCSTKRQALAVIDRELLMAFQPQTTRVIREICNRVLRLHRDLLWPARVEAEQIRFILEDEYFHNKPKRN